MDTKVNAEEEAYGPPEAGMELVSLGDSEDEIDIKEKDQLEDNLLSNVSRLTLRDDIDREKFRLEKLLKQAPNDARLTHTSDWYVIVKDAKWALDTTLPVKQQWIGY